MISKSARHRAHVRAAVAWRAGKPHAAWQVLAEAGLAHEWPAFQRVALRQARRRYLTAMSV